MAKIAKRIEPASEELFYVRIKDPLEFRKTLLGCLKDIILLLQMFEELKDIRNKKAEKTLELRKILADLSKLNSQLRLEMPKVNLGEFKATTVIRPEGSESSASVRHIVVPQKSHIEKLESELESIEAKLKRMM